LKKAEDSFSEIPQFQFMMPDQDRPQIKKRNSMKNLLKNAAFLALAGFVVAGLAGCTAEAKRKRHLERADAYFAKGEYQKAEIEYLGAAKLSQQMDPKIVHRLGTVYHAQGRTFEAWQVLAKAKELNAEDLDARYMLGTVLATLYKFNDARDEALFVLSKRPNDEKAAMLLADVSFTPENIQNAREKLTEMIRGGADTWAAHAALGQLALREKKMPEAHAEAEAAAKLNPKSPEVNVLRGEIATLEKNNTAAEEFLKSAMENSPPRTPAKLQLARLKIQLRDIPGAKKLLDDVIKETPDYVPAWALRGQIALAEQDFAECERITQNVLSWHPRSYDIRLLRARTFVLQEKTEKAVLEFSQLDAMFPNLAEVKYETAVAHVQGGSTELALKSLDEALRLNPGYPAAILLRAELKLRNGSLGEAITALLPYVKAYPDDARARLILANAYNAMGQNEQALMMYRELETQLPNVPQFPTFTGTILVRMGRFDEARASFERAVKTYPLFISAAEALVDLDLQQKNFAAADQRVKEQLALHTNAPAAMMIAAKVALAKGETNASMAILKEVTQKAPEASALYVLLAQINSASGNNANAIAQFKNAVDRNPNDVTAQLQLGMSYDTAGDFKNARKQYETVVKLNPRVALAWNNLAYLLSEHFNELDAAATAAGKARELQPNDPSTADTVGWVHFRRGEYAQALNLLRESSGRLPKNPDITYHLARAEYAMGLEDAARFSLKKVVAQKGNSNDVQEAVRRLAVLDAGTDAQSMPILEAAVKKDAADYLAVFHLGQAYEISGANEKAVALFERATKLNSSVAAPLQKMAALYADKLNDLPKGLEAAKAARRISPGDPVVAGLLGRLSYRSGDYASAVALIQENAKSSAADVELLYDLALAYYSVGQFEQARVTLADYQARASAGARGAEARDLFSLLDFQDGKGSTDSAQKIASARLSRDGNDIPALMTMGLARTKEGKFQEAVQRLEQIISLNKSFAPAQRELALLYSEHLGNDYKAIEYATKARNVYDKDFALAKALGKAAYRKGDYRLCATVLAQATPQGGPDAEMFYYLGLAYEKSNKPAEARQALQVAMSAAPGSKHATAAKEAFDRLAK
jgi:tetratricopeptide (TPR) repeat protein